MNQSIATSQPSRTHFFVPIYCGLLLSAATIAAAMGVDPGLLVLAGMVAGSQLAWIAVAQLHDPGGALDGSRSAVVSLFGTFIATGLTVAVGASLLEGIVMIHSLDGPFVPIAASAVMALLPFAIVAIALCWWFALHQQTRDLDARAANLRILHILGGLALGTLALASTVFFSVRGHGFLAGMVSALAGVGSVLVLCWASVPWFSALLMRRATDDDQRIAEGWADEHIAGSEDPGGHLPGTLSHGQTIAGTRSAA